MNSEPEVTRIVCFGDSLTYGKVPGKNLRHPANVRWTGIAQSSLGPGYEIIEEGLRSRTTNIDDSEATGRNGAAYFHACVLSHLPFDLLVFMLGTNDLKDKFNREPEQVAVEVEKLLKDLDACSQEFEVKTPKILLVSPPIIDSTLLKNGSAFFYAVDKSKKLAELYATLAQKIGCDFLDAAKIVGYGRVDGVHLDAEQNKVLGEAMAAKVREVWPDSR